MDFYTKTFKMKTMTQKVIKWKNLMMISLILSSVISLTTICISVAIFDKIKNLEHKLFMIEKSLKK
jgi:hypothetical protein